LWKVFVRDREGRDVGQADLIDQPVTIGRDPDRVLCLQSAAVSRRHARFTVEGGRVVITDEGSANGVKVDGRRIAVPTPVGLESRIEIAEFVIRAVPFTAAEAAARGAQPPRPRRPLTPEAGMPPIDVTAPFNQAELQAAPPPAPAALVVAPVVAGPAGPVPAPAAASQSGRAAAPTPSTLSGALAAVKAGIRLIGRGGPYDGRVFEITREEMFVGRVAGNDVVLDDTSISRRHARLRLLDAGTRLEIFDLRSANGTFINGERVKLEACAPGDKLRFGDLLFRVESAAAPGVSATDIVGSSGRKRRAAVIAVVGVLLLGGVTGAALWKRSQRPVDTGPDARERLQRLQARVQERIDAGKVAMKRQRWEPAERAFGEALEVDPLNDEARRLKVQVHREIEFAEVFKQANEAFELGTRQNLERARDLYAQIPADSFYHQQVKYKLKQINRNLAGGYRTEGLGQLKAKYYDKAAAALCTFFELMGDDEPTPGEEKVRDALTDAEGRLKKSKDYKPCQAARFVGKVKPAGTDTAADPEELISAKYPDAKLRETVLLYQKGRIDPALRKLKELENDKSMRDQIALVREVRRNLEVVRGKYEEGYSAYRERKAADARREWDYVLEADKNVLPAGVESFYKQEITRLLGDLYYDLGDDEFKRQRYREAYGFWADGNRVNPKHGGILNGLLKLEEEGRKAVEEGSKEKLQLARDITQPDSTVHQAALKALGE
jgi:pSer/pThr/pTyr-binding forkhead associated (FHA) protein/tetratricopeptide (TPR) repeat protein